MADMVFEEFQKYAKEFFGCDVKKDTSHLESFEKIFDYSFIAREKEYELPEKYPEILDRGLYCRDSGIICMGIISNHLVNIYDDCTYENNNDMCIAA